MPLCSLVWPDEHPGGELISAADGTHKQCQASVIRLARARTHLWRTGSVPEESRELWEDARRVLPEWPGFRRLALNPEQLKSLEGCAEELGDLMGAIRQRFPDDDYHRSGRRARPFQGRAHTSDQTSRRRSRNVVKRRTRLYVASDPRPCMEWLRLAR